jgi:FkbM family methyltransferase
VIPVKTLVYFFTAKVRPVLILKLVRFIIQTELLGSDSSRKIEGIFDPNNIRRKVSVPISKSKVKYKASSGSIFVLNLNDHVDWKMFIQDSFNLLPHKILQILKQESLLDWTFLDVGANFGSVCIPIARENAVIAFEPQEWLSERIEVHARMNFVKDLKVETLALTSNELVRSKGTFELFSPPGNSGASSFTQNWNLSKAKVHRRVVEVTSLDLFWSERFENTERNEFFLKIDVEGEEINVLRGGDKFISFYRPFILLEHRQDLLGIEKSEALFEFLNKLTNYRKIWIDESNLASKESKPGDFSYLEVDTIASTNNILLVPLEKKGWLYGINSSKRYESV